MDQFYAILTGEEDAFYKMCMALPGVINSVVNEKSGVSVPHDTVIEELQKVAEVYSEQQLGKGNDGMLKRIYEYAKKTGIS